MAVTRIKNNQITDSTIVANSKIQNYTVTSALLANNITYNSDLTVSGNLTVQGQTTTIDTNVTTIEDPVIILASNQTGSPSVDIGFIGERGTSDNIAFVWDESADEFVTAFTSTSETNTTITISSYANFHTNDANIGGNIVINGTTSLVGNVTGNLSVTGNIAGGNLLTPGLISATGNVTGGNLITAGLASVTGNITGGNLITSALVSAATVTASGNVTGGNLITAGLISATGNINGTGAVFSGNVTAQTFIGNISGNIDAGGANTNIQFNDGDILAGSAAFTFDKTSNAVVASGNITGGNVNTAGQVVATGNVTGGNLITAGLVSAGTTITATGNVIGGNVTTAGQVVATGNVTGGNLITAGLASVTGNITGGNVTTAGKANIGTLEVTGTGTVTGNITGGNLNTAGQVVATGNVTGGNLITAGLGSFGTTVTATGNITGGNLTTSGKANIGTLEVTGTGTVTGNLSGGNLNTAGQVVATGNVTGGNLITAGLGSFGTTVTATGNITGGNLITAGLISATGNITGGNLSAGTGNVTGGNINSNSIVGTTITVAGTSVDFNLTGNISLSSRYINDLADPVQSQDAATKIYVDTVAQGLDVKASVLVATANTLANYTGGTITYNNGTDGVGATLTTSGTYTTIDGQSIATIGTRVLVKNEANAAHNGIYTYANSTTIVRSTDFDIASEMPSAFTFVEHGSTNADTGWVCTTNAPITVGTTNINFSQFSGAGTYTAGNALSLNGTQFNVNTDGNIGVNGSNQLYIVTGATINNPNITAATGTSLTVTGNVTGGNIISNALISGVTVTATGNVTGGNLITAGLGSFGTTVTATGNITGGNLITAGLASVTGNVTGGNLITAGQVVATGNVTGGNLITAGLGSFGTTVTATGNITGGNLITAGLISVTGNVNGTGAVFSGNVTAQNFIGNISGNVDAGGANTNIQFNDGDILNGSAAFTFDKTSNAVVATGNITGANITTAGKANIGTLEVTGTGSVTGNITGGNVNTAGQVVATGNVTGGNLITAGLGSFGTTVTATGNVIGGNVTTAGQVVATGNVTGGNLITAGLASVTGNVTGGNLITAGLASVTGNVTGGNLNTAGQVVATGNVTGGNVIATALVTGANVSATANVTGANIVGTTKGTFGNIVISGDDITDTNGRVNFNTAGADVDFAVNGDTVANVFYVDAGTGTASFGSATQTTGAIVAFNATNSVLMPVGNVGQRPGTGVTGMLRFNTTSDALEVYDADGWTTVGVPSFTVITDQQFNGDGSQVNFTLANAATTASTIVSINGVLQIPTTAYSVSGTTLTFTEAPLTGDLIDVRALTTTTQVTEISNASGNAVVSTLDTANTVQITGELLPAGNVAQSLGSPTKYWKSLYVGGNTIYLGNLQLKAENGTMAFYESDGTTPAPISSGSVDTSLISSGTSSVAVIAAGGNVRTNIAGATVQTISTSGVAITGDLSVTGNATLSGNILGDRIQNGTTQIDIQTQNGNANITVAGTSNVAVFSTAGANITGILGVTGNITGGNLSGTSIVGTLTTAAQTNITSVGTLGSLSVTGNITGGNITTTGIANIGTLAITGNSTVAGTETVTGNIIGGNVNTAGKVTASTLQSNVATGTAPLTVSSTTLVTNLNADLLDGLNSASTNTVSTIVARDASGNFAAGTITATLSGAATTAGTVTTAAQPNITSVGTLSSLSVTANVAGGNVTTSGVFAGSGAQLTNIPAANVTGTLSVNTTGYAATVSTAAQPNITSVGTLSSLAVTGNITGGNLSVGTGTITGGNIVNSNANGIGNIGSSTTYFNTVFAKATSAQYADLAEKYAADAEYPAGTVVVFGGDKEVTVTSVDADRAVAGVISTNPSYIMNGGLEAEFVATVALTGRVPCRVTGTVRKGDLMVSAGYGLARAEQDPKVGTVIGKALENFEGNEGVIEVVVGRF